MRSLTLAGLIVTCVKMKRRRKFNLSFNDD